MNHDSTTRHRRSLRLPAYDYAWPGAYFVTIVCRDRECLFGEVIQDRVNLSGPGRMIESVWRELPERYRGVELDAFIVMPNHVHGIIILVGATPRGCPSSSGQAQGPAPTISLPDVIHRFKSLTTAKYRHAVDDRGWPPFRGRLWQRNYYEHVIRDQAELDHVRRYIAANPTRWAEDIENPEHTRRGNLSWLP